MVWPGGHDDEELTESGGQIEAEAPPLTDHLPRFVAELADCSTVEW